MNNKLTILIGLPCSGKTTYTQSIDDVNTIILSSDAIRIELFGYENQDDNHKVFQTMEIRCREALKLGRSVVYDATNLSRKKRKHLISTMKRHCSKVECICFVCDFDELLERNKIRKDRHIPKEVMIRMIKNFQFPTVDEGFDRISFKCTTEKIINNDLLDLFYKSYDDFFDIYVDIHYMIHGKLFDYNQDNPHHNDTLGWHIHNVIDGCYQRSYGFPDYDRIILLISALYHDIGKPLARTWDNKANHARYIGHNNISSYIFLCDVMNTFISNYSQENPFSHGHIVPDILTLIELHDFIFSYDSVEHAKSKLEPEIGGRLWDLLQILNEADRERY